MKKLQETSKCGGKQKSPKGDFTITNQLDFGAFTERVAVAFDVDLFL